MPKEVVQISKRHWRLIEKKFMEAGKVSKGFVEYVRTSEI